MGGKCTKSSDQPAASSASAAALLDTMPDPVVVAPSGKHTATVIFLHGLGDTGHGWASTIAGIRPAHVKVICPTAAKMPVSLNSGFQMPSWFDLLSLDPDGKEDEAGIKRAAQLVDLLIDEEVKTSGLSSERVLVGGFSQGGALALYTALHTRHKLAGVVALSCWYPLHKQIGDVTPTNKEIPYLQAHGDCDPVVPYKWGQLTSQKLREILPNHEFKSYKGMMHSSSEEEMRDVKQFLAQCLP